MKTTTRALTLCVLATLLSSVARGQDIHPAVSLFATVGPTANPTEFLLHPEVWCTDGGVLDLLFFCEVKVIIPPSSDSCDVCAIVAAAINNDPGCQSQGFSASCDSARLTVSNNSALGCTDAFVCFDPAGLSALKTSGDYTMKGAKMKMHAHFSGVATGLGLVQGQTPTVTVLHYPVLGDAATFAAVVDVTQGMTGQDIATALAAQLMQQGDLYVDVSDSPFGRSLGISPAVHHEVLVDIRDDSTSWSSQTTTLGPKPAPGLTTPITTGGGTLGETTTSTLAYDLTVRNTAEGIDWAISPIPEPWTAWGHAVVLDTHDVLPLEYPALTMVLEDFNGDGYPDVVVLERESAYTALDSESLLEVFINAGDGTYLPPSRISLGSVLTNGSVGRDLAAADYDFDTDLDLYVLDQGRGLLVMENLGNGSFVTAFEFPVLGATTLSLGTIDGDGVPDVALGREGMGDVVIGLSNFGAPVFSGFLVEGQPHDVVLVDLDGLNGDDLVVGHSTSTEGLSVYHHQAGGGAYTLHSSFSGMPVSSVSTGDIDRDGDLDVAVAWVTGSELGILVNTTGTLDLLPGVPGLPFASSVHLGDMNGDGDPDLLVPSWDGSLAVPTGNSDGSFYTITRLVTGLGPVATDSADVDQDGRTDAAVLDAWDQTLTILRNTTPAMP